MSEPRAQRTVAPTDLLVDRRARAARGARRAFAPDDAFIVFAYAMLEREAAALARQSSRSATARRRPTRSISCASPRAGCASRCGCSAACCRARTCRALPRRPALVRELARRRSRPRRLHGQLQGLLCRLAAGAARRLERLRALPAPRARRSAATRATAAFASPRAAALFDDARAIRRGRAERRRRCAVGAR